ncbi:phosphatase PAP2 family protein [Goodfellowiella coeruleoviolacea]|uniref:phosphatase PAP2 family protein n=1 Tax=Goodfellowiella coeruleoviolacea TaxID=334858 RepID=UPI0020A3D682|nr:phosphatase PAP2 family protein [Goodfellowiella coeruleoviolacea]
MPVTTGSGCYRGTVVNAVGILENAPTGIEDVPDASAAWYLDIVRFAATTPEWFQSFAGLFTEGAIVLLLGFMLLGWWRARRLPARSMAFALLAPVGMVAAYLLSEVIKVLYQVERPCRTLGDVVTIAECPPPGDWSFPSNHSVIAGAAALGILMAWRLLGTVAVVVALAAAASRVFVGAHYPHDAIVGIVLGALVAAVVVLLLVRPVTKLVGRIREHDKLGALLATDAVRYPVREQGGDPFPPQEQVFTPRR